MTARRRTGVPKSTQPGTRTRTPTTATISRPGVPGGSGSGVLSSGGAAVGLLTTLHLRSDTVSEGVTDLAKALAHVDTTGGLGDVELALGTQAFDPQPPGVPLTELATPAGPPLGV